MNESDTIHLKSIIRHITNVQNNCQILADRLIDKGENELGIHLIANSFTHDNSKFYGIEWLYLRDNIKKTNKDLFDIAIKNHVLLNKHHPEAWEGGIHVIDRLHMAEMVADWAARSSEFGKDLRDWIKTQATKKFAFTVQSKVYKEIKDLIEILLDAEFK